MQDRQFLLYGLALGLPSLTSATPIVTLSGGGTASGGTLIVIGQPLVGPTSQAAVIANLGFVPSSQAGSALCLADITGIGGPPSPPDGLVTGDDFIAFINAFSTGDSIADVTSIGGPPSPPDDLVTGDDFIAFINAFATTCP